MPNQESKKSYKFFAPKVFIRTFGCQMNVRDSEVICGLLKAEGWELKANSEEADVIIFNTCSVRQHAEDKVWSEIGRLAKLKKIGTVPFGKHSRALTGTVPIIGVVGCMAQNYKEKIFERAAGVDFVVGPQDLHKIPGIIEKLAKNGERKNRDRHLKTASVPIFPIFSRKIWETEGEVRPDEIYHTGFYEDKSHTYIVISEGCSNYCSYCVVPYVRGELRNRNYKDILKEIEEAVAKGINKITLLGQNVNAYQCDGVNFVKLVREVGLVKGLKEFSFITSHPKDTDTDLFKAMADENKLKKYLHLPIQSGSDRILNLMNRGYTKKIYLDLAENYRKIVRDAVLTTDIIVGFPSEREEDFKATYNLVKALQFDSAYIFKYSPRPHTKAENLKDDVPREEKERRHSLILELQKDISRKRKVQSVKRKVSRIAINELRDPSKAGKTQNLKFLVLSFGFALCVLTFAPLGYALNLDKLKTHILSGDYKSAILEGERMMAGYRQSSASDELCYLLGLSYLKDGNYLRSSDIFEIILKEYKDSRFKDEARLGLGDSYFLREDFEQAKYHYLELLEDNPKIKLAAQVYSRLSQIGFKTGDIRAGKLYLVQLKQDFPMSLEVILIDSNSPPFYTVQVGSFSNSINARNLKQKLIQQGYPAYIEEIDSSGKVSYRVRVGKSNLRQEILDLEKRLSQQGYPTKPYP